MLKKISAVIAVVVMLLAITPAAEAAPKKFTVTVSSSARSVNLGSTLTISGRVSPRAAGQTVTIQKKIAGGEWKVEKVVRLSSSSTFRYVDRPTTATRRQYRVYKPKHGTTKANYSTAVAVDVRRPALQAATIAITTLSPRTVNAGDQLTVTGRTSANLVGRVVTVQRLSGSSWLNWGSARVTAARTFAASVKATQAGAGQRLRTYATATSTTKAASSASASFTVFGWYYLNSQTPVSRTTNFTSTQGVAQMSGALYTNSIRALWSAGSFGGWKRGEVQYNLGGHCRQLQARIGVDDTAGEKSSWNFVVSGDSVDTDFGFVGLGGSRVINHDVRGVLRLKLTNTRLDGTPYQQYRADAIWAAARVNCAF